MKIFICCVILITNISTKGKASVDNTDPAGSNVLLKDNTKAPENLSCYRPCKFNVKPKRCHYIFKVEPSTTEDGKIVIAVNHSIPGPPINVCLNDIVVVEVQNKIPDQDLAIHWNGLDQVGTPYMDGVPMITQCPINYGSTYKYAFRASKPGTYFYHAHSVSHQSDGVFGPLIISQPLPLEPHLTVYDYDRSKENTLLISAVFSNLFTASLEDLNSIKPTSLAVNGDNSYRIFMMEGYVYRLRLINAIAIDCPITFSVEEHDIIVIASDGAPVKAVASKKVLLYPGERMDVVVQANHKPGSYRMHINGRSNCLGLSAKAYAMYSGINYTSMLLGAHKTESADDHKADLFIISGQMLRAIKDVPNSSSNKSVYLGIDKNIVNIKENDNDFQYSSDALPRKPFFPAPFTLRKSGVVQINNKSFLYPNAPFLTQQNDVPDHTVCLVGSEETNPEPQCVYTMKGLEGEVVELSLVNEGLNSNDSYTFHIHGYSMEVLTTWQCPEKKPLTKDKFLKLEKEGKIIRNILDPPLKNTISVPNKGYTIVRLKLDNPGAWILECRSCGISSSPTAVIINVPQIIPKTVTDSLPKCGNYRPPDVLLN